MSLLFDDRNQPTTLQAGDVMVCELENPLVRITRNNTPLHFRDVGSPDMQDNKMLLLGLKPSISTYRTVVDLIATTSGLDVEKPDIRDRIITFTFIVRS